MNVHRTDNASSETVANLALLNDFNALLVTQETEVEFYFMGGAVLSQAFNASPGTAHISKMFRPAGVVRDAAAEIARRQTLPADWLQGSVRSVLAEAAHPGAFLELSHVSVFVPLAGYVLAVKCAAMRLGADSGDLEDVRYVLRAMNITSTEQAMSVVEQYFTERQLVSNTKAALEKLLEA